MVDDEGEEDEPAQHHAARGEGRFDRVLAPVVLGPGPPVLDREPDRVIDVREHDDEEKGADHPEQRPEVAQMLGIAIDPLRPEEDLEIAEEMPDDEENEDDPGHRHDHFPSDG